MNKINLFFALSALLTLPAFSFAATTADLDDGPNSTWPAVLTLTTAADGAASQGAQSFTMNVTALPTGGATYRVYKTTANGSDNFGNPVALSLGSISKIVTAVTSDRTVTI